VNVLLLRPVPRNERFGLGPFFRTEPLGLEYIAAALEASGHDVTVRDLRFGRPVEYSLTTTKPDVVGVACMHALEIDDTLDLIARVRTARPDVFILVGGHSAAAYPTPFFVADVNGICLDDGERVMPELVAALERHRSLRDVPGLLLPGEGGEFERTPAPDMTFALDDVRLPARRLLRDSRQHYACLHHRPTYLVETARGCPFRCSFCSVWQLFNRSFRERSIGAVCEDFASVGQHVFVADDIFWHHASRSQALAEALDQESMRKQWLLVQSRVDLVATHFELLKAWRPIADEFDMFLGLESATNDGLSGLDKDATIDSTKEALRVARELGYGVTGNFVIDPDWDEHDFERLWDFVAVNKLGRAGFTILTPLPGTAYFESMRERISAVAWSQFDMHHVLWEPKLGAERFFHLYCETWKRSVLNLKGEKKLWQWMRHTRPRHWGFTVRALLRTQRMMSPSHYLREHHSGPSGTIAPSPFDQEVRQLSVGSVSARLPQEARHG